jgi:predicted unusual protein kinase regulating ubiquinone biosynthesis (AarF/ABC1/UbiB family)
MNSQNYPKESSKLRKRVQKAITAGIWAWQTGRNDPLAKKKSEIDNRSAGNGSKKRSLEDVLTSIPRRDIEPLQTEDVSLPIIQQQTFKTSKIRAVSRLFVWVFMINSFLAGNLWDRLRGRDSQTRRAVRLRRTFERVGGTFIKFGQQMAMRIDLLPWAYTIELAKMLDRIPPFPLEQAIEIIERSTGKKWQEIFSVFDPEPIGSASVACVYQAILKTGEKVAVKVRRPKIGELFMADFLAFDWILDLAEFLTFFRPGYTENMRNEFKTILLEELDFVQEARFQDMFRRSARKTGKKFFTAPRLFHEYCNLEVIVQEYTSGIWLWEIMAGVEQQNSEALKRMRELNIDPQKVSEHLLWVNYWGMQENLFFHADPHPANVIVSRNSKLTFIDFGSCGSFNREQRAGLELTAMASGQNDAEGMARGTLKLFEPLPPLDVKELFQEAEAEYTRVLTIFKSKQEHTEWWERTSVRQWMSFFKFSRKNNIPVTIHTLRMIRATLLYDTVAVRVCKEVDRFDEYLKFKKFRERQAKERITDRIKDQAKYGLDDSAFLWFEEIGKTSEKLLFRTRNTLDSPLFNFSSLIGKWVFAASLTFKLLNQVGLITLLGAAITTIIQLINDQTLHFVEIISLVVTNQIYLAIVTILLFTNIRHILFRFRDQEV